MSASNQGTAVAAQTGRSQIIWRINPKDLPLYHQRRHGPLKKEAGRFPSVGVRETDLGW